MKLSYIVVTYKSQFLIEECIQSIHKFNTVGEYEIIVVDNSPPEDRMLVKEVCDRSSIPVKFIPNENLGYGQGNNVGIRAAIGDIICVINPDVRFIMPYVDVVESSFANDHQLGMLGFKQTGGYDLSFYVNPEYYFPFLNSAIVKLTNRLELYNSKFLFLSGACFFASRNKFLDVGLFDENMFLYNEESDINRRFRKKNYKIKYISNLKYLHLVDERSSISIPTLKHELNSLAHYMKKFNLSLKKNLFLKRIEYFFTSKSKYEYLKDFIRDNNM